MMKKGFVIVIVILFFGLTLSNPINANINIDKNKKSVEILSYNETFDYDSYTPIQLIFQLFNKLRNNNEIKILEEKIDYDECKENEILDIIKSDAELNYIIEKLKSFDCGCEDDYKPVLEGRRWFIVCTFLIPIWLFTELITIVTGADAWERIVFAISEIFNCGF